MKNILIFGLILSTFPFQAFAAQTDPNRTITALSVEPGNRGYFKVSEGFTLSCQYNVVYFDVESSSGKGYLSLLMAAKMSGKKVTITYNQNASNTCDISHVTVI